MTRPPSGHVDLRIARARMTFESVGGSPARASQIAQHALQRVAEQPWPAGRDRAPRAHVELTVRVPHGASDAAIAERIAETIHHHLGAGRDT